jgi:hypothetical protein
VTFPEEPQMPATISADRLTTPMCRGGAELLIGVVRDPHWGPMP